MATTVVRVAAPLPVWVVCDDDEVAALGDRGRRQGHLASRPGAQRRGHRRGRPAGHVRLRAGDRGPRRPALRRRPGLGGRLRRRHARARPPRRRHQRGLRPDRSRLHVRVRPRLVRRGTGPRPSGWAWPCASSASRTSVGTSTSPTISRHRPGWRGEPDARPAGARARTGHRRPSRRHRVQRRGHAGQVGRGRLRGQPPRADRRLEGHVGPGRGHRRARRHPRGRAAGGRRRHRGDGAGRHVRRGRRRADAPGWPSASGSPTGSACCGPTSCSATTRGGATGCIPTIATPVGSTVDGVVAARDPFFFPDQGVAHHRPDTLLLFEAEEPDHVEDVTGFEEAKVAALLAHRSQFVTTMEIDPDDTGPQRDAFRAKILDRMRDGRRTGRGRVRRGLQGDPGPLNGPATMTAASDRLLAALGARFEAARDPEQAVRMAAYMRDQFAFYGIPNPTRVALEREAVAEVGAGDARRARPDGLRARVVAMRRARAPVRGGQAAPAASRRPVPGVPDDRATTDHDQVVVGHRRRAGRPRRRGHRARCIRRSGP